MCPLEDPPLGVRFEDVDDGMSGGCLERVLWCDGYFNSEGVEVWGGLAAEELIAVEGGDGSLAPCGGASWGPSAVRRRRGCIERQL